jgi:ectoine hydroxylase-related dioxygenase (phytanoyl-CoA dioxygenase family)
MSVATVELPPCKGKASLPEYLATQSAEQVMEGVRANGAAIIRGFLDADTVASLNSEIDEHLHGIRMGSTLDDEFIRAFHGKNTKRMTNLVTLCPTFREHVIDADLLHGLGELSFREESGDWWMTTAQAIDIGPNSPAQPLHRDCQNNPPIAALGARGPMVISNFFIALSDFTLENGATRVIPGSNLAPTFEFDPAGEFEDTYWVPLKAGDVMFFDGKVTHGGGANVTDDQWRRAVAVAIQPAWITPEEAYPFLIPMDLARTLSRRAQRIVGFRSLYPNGSPGLWQNNYQEIADYIGLDD